MSSFLISKFDKSTISNLVKECFGYDFPDIIKKPQVNYIFKYLQKLKAESILLELNYLDKDYLEDFSRYYVKRFGNDGHKCARMHFFSSTINHKKLSDILKNTEKTDELEKSYLGFMIIKPLPQTFIGKTCLKILDDEDSTTKTTYKLKRKYQVDLFGINLCVSSIAFQEQDKVVAACATTAIWSALHSLEWKNIRSIRSCSEITVNAINHIDGSSNSFPNKALSNKQILRSLDAEGVRYHHTALTEQSDFENSITAHINSELPMILTGKVLKVDYDGKNRILKSYEANHAICITGYSFCDGELTLYVHDDRQGPYVRAKLVNLQDTTPNHSWALGIQRIAEDGTWAEPHEIILPEFLAVLADQKTRLPFDLIENTSSMIKDSFLNIVNIFKEPTDNIENNLSGKIGDALSYKIRLRNISNIRQEFRTHASSKNIAGFETSEEEYQEWSNDKENFLTKSLARLQWTSEFYFDKKLTFTVLIDATDIPQGNAISAVLVHDILTAKPILKILKEHGNLLLPSDEHETEYHFFRSFLRYLQDKEETIENYLDNKYGPLRAPRMLKHQEFKDDDISPNNTRQIIYDAVSTKLEDLHPRFSKSDVKYIIWAIGRHGELIIGEEILTTGGHKCGHPSITQFRPARIAGEAHKNGDIWEINSKSGRYSHDREESTPLLNSALLKFQSFFPKDKFEINDSRLSE